MFYDAVQSYELFLPIILVSNRAFVLLLRHVIVMDELMASDREIYLILVNPFLEMEIRS